MEPDFQDPSFIDDPHPTYAWLREHSPVHLGKDGIWLITRHADVALLNKDPRLGRDLRRWVAYAGVRPYLADSELERCVEQWMFSLDPPEHTRLRRLVAKVFTPINIAALAPVVWDAAEEMFEELDDLGDFDFVQAFAAPFPVRVIAKVIGLEVEDFERLKLWSEALSRVVEPGVRRREKLVADELLRELAEYLRRQIEARRRARRDDLLSQLVGVEESGDRLSESELVANLVFLLIAGHETTTHLIGNALVAFARHPDQLARLQARPELTGRAVEEALRWDGPANVNARVAHEPIELGDRTVEPGQLVFNMLGAANRDPAVFADPDRFDVGRDPNPHVSFGGGPHFCLGAALARLEGRVAFDHMLERFDRWRVELGGLVRRPVVNLRGYEKIPVRVLG